MAKTSAPIIQIFGTKKDSDTRKAERFFKERGVKPHFVDVTQKAPSRGELENVARAVGTEALIDPDSDAYKKRGLQYMDYDPLEEVAENPLLLKLPVVRNGKRATVGYDPESWSEWLR